MPDYPLIVFAAADAPVPLAVLRDLMLMEGQPANFGVDIAGEATEEQLREPDWDVAFLRWLEPEIHEVALVESMALDKEDEASRLVASHLSRIARLSDIAGRLIVVDQLNRTRRVYGLQVLPALISAEDHDAWNALDILVRFLCKTADGLIYADAEGYCDADGELLLSETDDPNPADNDGPELGRIVDEEHDQE